MISHHIFILGTGKKWSKWYFYFGFDLLIKSWRHIVAISDYVRLFQIYFWPFLTIFNYFWLFMRLNIYETILDYFLLWLWSLDEIWLSQWMNAISVYFWLFITIYKVFWVFQTFSEYFRLFLIFYDFLIISDFLWPFK